jgi:hypothetical protein
MNSNINIEPDDIETGEYLVADILKHKIVNDEIFYLVNWKNKKLEKSWEPACNLENNSKFLKYCKKHKILPMAFQANILDTPINLKQASQRTDSYHWFNAVKEELNTIASLNT